MKLLIDRQEGYEWKLCLELIKKALVGVVSEPHGTGSRARVKGITVAGKTGTAQIIALEAEKDLKEGGGIPDHFRDHAWFVAIAPAERPRLALAVLVEHGGHGGSAAAPIARELIKEYQSFQYHAATHRDVYYQQ